MFLLVFTIMACSPAHTEASFFSGIISKITGSPTEASQVPAPVTDEVVHNSQNMPLLESSINPDMKSVDVAPTTNIIEDKGLISTNGPLGPSDDLEKYASTAKINTYKVKKGDTIEGIAKKFKVSKDVIIESNADLKKSDLLKVGQVLVILSIKDQAITKDTNISDNTAENKDTKAVYLSSPNTPVPAKKADNTTSPEPTTYTFDINTVSAPQAPVVDQSTPPVQTTTPDTSTTPEGQPSGDISGNYIWPFPKGVGRVSQGLHADSAYDFAAPKGTPIYAVHDGTVLIAHPTGYNGGYGLYVVIDFTDGRQAIFGHMSKVVAKAGDVVKQGDVIGYVGSTGHSTGAHCHIGFHGDLGNPYIGLKVNSKDIVEND